MEQATGLKAQFDRMTSLHNPYLQRAQECSKYTIPSLIPPEGSTGATRLVTPYQSMGARGVNNLAAKLLLTLLHSPFFRLTLDDFMLERLAGQRGMRAAVEEALNSMERAVMNEIEASGIRPSLFEALRLLLVSGNALLYVNPDGGMKVFRLDRYRAKRDPMGNLLLLITKESVSPLELPPQTQAAIAALNNTAATPGSDDSVELFTCVKREKTSWKVWQEAGGEIIPGTEGTYPLAKSPWIALRFIAVNGEDYGRGFVEEYLGDLQSLEGLSKAIVQASAAAAKVVFFVKPNSTTSHNAVANSESGAVLEGDANDVSTLQLDKQADLRVAYEAAQKLTDSLSFSFLLNTAIQRNGERVTAEEIRYLAGELDAGLGGVHATLGQEFQLPLITIKMFQMERKGRLPLLPEGAVKPTVTTGVEALGRTQDRTRLAGLLQDISPLGPKVIETYLNPGDFIKRSGVALGIDMKGLVPTDEEIAQRQQQEQMAAMVQQLGPNAINQAGALAKQGMSGQQ